MKTLKIPVNIALMLGYLNEFEKTALIRATFTDLDYIFKAPTLCDLYDGSDKDVKADVRSQVIRTASDSELVNELERRGYFGPVEGEEKI